MSQDVQYKQESIPHPLTSKQPHKFPLVMPSAFCNLQRGASLYLATISQPTMKPKMTCYHINFLLAHLLTHQRTLISKKEREEVVSNIYEGKKGWFMYKDKSKFCIFLFSILKLTPK